MTAVATQLPTRRADLVIRPIGEGGRYVVKESPRQGYCQLQGISERICCLESDTIEISHGLLLNREKHSPRFYDGISISMTDVTLILSQIEDGDPSAAEQLLPLVYDELRKLAAHKMAQESSDHTLQPTALVHEAYVRLVDNEQAQHWDSRGHFFAAAAEAMRRILVESARRKSRLKHGGGVHQQALDENQIPTPQDDVEILAIHEALDRLAEADKQAAELVKLRYFAGMTVQQAAQVLGISERSAYYTWDYARSWLRTEMQTD